jgi:hypothetical protein
MFSVAPCEIVSLKLKFDSFVKMRVAQGILDAKERINNKLYKVTCSTPFRSRSCVLS